MSVASLLHIKRYLSGMNLNQCEKTHALYSLSTKSSFFLQFFFSGKFSCIWKDDTHIQFNIEKRKNFCSNSISIYRKKNSTHFKTNIWQKTFFFVLSNLRLMRNRYVSFCVSKFFVSFFFFWIRSSLLIWSWINITVMRLILLQLLRFKSCSIVWLQIIKWNWFFSGNLANK